LQQFNNLQERFKSGAPPYEFEEFLEMVDMVHRPFVCQIDGHEVSLSQDNCTIMMETSIMKAITESLFAGKAKRNGLSQDLNQQNKQQNCGNPTV